MTDPTYKPPKQEYKEPEYKAPEPPKKEEYKAPEPPKQEYKEPEPPKKEYYGAAAGYYSQKSSYESTPAKSSYESTEKSSYAPVKPAYNSYATCKEGKWACEGSGFKRCGSGSWHSFACAPGTVCNPAYIHHGYAEINPCLPPSYKNYY